MTFKGVGIIPFPCPDQDRGGTGTRGVTWYSVTTFDGGDNWTDSAEIFHSDDWAWCVVNNTIDAEPFRNFGFVRDRGGAYYIVINDQRTSLLAFQSRTQGLTWRGPISVPLGDAAGAPSVFTPTLASDDVGRVGVSFYASEPTDTQVALFFAAATDANTHELSAWQSGKRVSTFYVPNTTGQAVGARQLGDYNGMAAIPNQCGSVLGPTFFPAWIDLSRIDPANFPAADLAVAGVTVQ